MNWKIKKRMVEKFGSQVDFAEAVGISETLVSKVVRGRRQLDPAQKAKWAEILGCQPEDVF